MYWYVLNVSRMLTDRAEDVAVAMCEKTFIDAKKLPSLESLSKLKIFLVRKRRNTLTTVQSDVTATVKDSRKQTTHCLNTVTNIACIAGVSREGVGIG